MLEKKKQFEFYDNENTVKVEKKHLYLNLISFNEYFYMCYKNMDKIQRNSYGQIILNKLSNCITIISKIYFSKYDYETLENLFLLVKDIEFHIRILNQLHILTKKQILNLSKYSAELSNYIKEFINTDELCKQS